MARTKVLTIGTRVIDKHTGHVGRIVGKARPGHGLYFQVEWEELPSAVRTWESYDQLIPAEL